MITKQDKDLLKKKETKKILLELEESLVNEIDLQCKTLQISRKKLIEYALKKILFEKQNK